MLKWRHQLSLIPLAEFPLPASLQNTFSQGLPLVLESETFITVNQLLPSQQRVLSLSIGRHTNPQDTLALQMILTAVFYVGILLCVIIWIYPLIKRLQLLRHSAKAFGEGDFAKRIQITNTSYIIDIENELKKAINYERNRQLNQYSKIYYNKIKKNLDFNG